MHTFLMIKVKMNITYQFRSGLRRCVQLLPVVLFLKTKEKEINLDTF